LSRKKKKEKHTAALSFPAEHQRKGKVFAVFLAPGVAAPSQIGQHCISHGSATSEAKPTTVSWSA